MTDHLGPHKATVSRGLRTAVVPQTVTLLPLWKLTALPRSDFDATFGFLLREVQTAINHQSATTRTAVQRFDEFVVILRSTLQVLQSRVIPKDLPTEDAARVTELMRFGLALGMGAQAVFGGPEHTRIEGASDWEELRQHLVDLAGTEGWDWLEQEPIALRALRDFFDDTKPSELRAVALVAQERLSALRTVNSVNIETAGPGKIDRAPEALVEPQEAKGWVFVDWVKSKLSDGTLTVNQADSLIHGLSSGRAFLRVPEIYEAAATELQIPRNRIQNQFTRLRLHHVVDGHNLFSAKVAGHRCRGMIVVSTDRLWSRYPGESDCLVGLKDAG